MLQQRFSDRAFHTLGWVLVGLATLIAIIGAKSEAGGWNDGSRLASVEVFGERGTFIIDDSIYLKVPPVEADRPTPYPKTRPDLLTLGTQDKLLINGHYYSDKSPVLTVLMAVPYRLWLTCGGPTAAERPDWFCWMQTVTSSGLAFVISVACIWHLGLVIGLTRWWSLALPFVMTFASIAPVYSQQVNSHIVMLGVTSALCLALATNTGSAGRCVGIGLLTGFGYTIDLGLGPMLMGAVLAFVGYQTRRIPAVLCVLLGMAPWLITHHALNYIIGGTIGPLNAVPEYLQWPGSPFTTEIATGGLKHKFGWFFVYAIEMHYGNKGFLFHNMPLLLTPGGAILLARYSPATRPALGFGLLFCCGGWLLYAAMSRNMSGLCCSVRWFVPFIAPALWTVGLLMRDIPRYRPDFIWLTIWGAIMTVVMMWAGPWTLKMVPGYWGWVAVGTIGWGIVRYREWRQSRTKHV